MEQLDMEKRNKLKALQGKIEKVKFKIININQ